MIVVGRERDDINFIEEVFKHPLQPTQRERERDTERLISAFLFIQMNSKWHHFQDRIHASFEMKRKKNVATFDFMNFRTNYNRNLVFFFKQFNDFLARARVLFCRMKL